MLLYPAGVRDVAACPRDAARLKVARHAACLHGCALAPDPDSPYAAAPARAADARETCACAGVVPPAGHAVRASRADQINLAPWAQCGRCGHALEAHGRLDADPPAEQVRRAKVAIRLDELLEVRGGD